MDTTDANAGSARKANPKLRRSCESCRNSKSRCISTEDGTRCQRCSNHGKQCVFLSAKPRLQKSKSSRVRVAEMEHRLDELMTILSSRVPTETSTGGSSSSPSEQTHVTPAESEDAPQVCPPTPSEIPSTMSRTPWGDVQFPWSSPSIVVDKHQDVISRGLVDIEKAEAAVRYFRTLATKFPFVVIPDHMSIEFLRQNKPFLLLAVIAIGTQYDLKLQALLDEELRESLCKKVIMNGEKSLDLLQGLLAYLSWYHHFFHPERQQHYQFSQLAVAMATDLGIANPSPRPLSENSLTVVLPSRANKEDAGIPIESENQRAFLGAYHFSSSLCISLKKTNSLMYRQYVQDCCQSLARNAEMDTDRLIPYLVQIQRLNEEINMAFDLDGQNQLRELDPFRIELLVKSFNERLDVLRSSFLPEIWDISSIAISYYHTRIYVYEVAFHAVRPSPSDLAGPQLSNNSWYFANARTEMLIRCLNAATTYVDHYISLRPDDIYSLVSTDQMKLLYAILVLGRLATCVKDDAPLLDAGLVRTMANIDYYLASVIQKLEGLLTSDANGQTRQNYIYHLSFLFQHSRRWYNQLEAAGDTGLTANFPSMFCTDAILPCPKNNESRKEDQMWSDFVNMGSTSIVDAFNIP